MTYEQEQALLTQNAEMKKQLESLTTALKALTQPEPIKIPWGDLLVDPALVSSGKVVIEPPPEEEVKLKEGQISRNDPNLGKHMQEIAAGKLEVV